MTVTPSASQDPSAADQPATDQGIAGQNAVAGLSAEPFGASTIPFENRPSLSEFVKQAAELLPSQGPITAFAFLNPLQGLHSTPFIDALRQVKGLFGSEPFLLESEYRKRLASGVIDPQDLLQTVQEETRDINASLVAQLIDLTELRMSMLLHSINPGTDHELRWQSAETDAFTRFRPEVSSEDRQQLIESTKRWVNEGFPIAGAWPNWLKRDDLTAAIQEVLSKTRQKSLGDLDDSGWEAVCLTLLWKITRRRTATMQPQAPPTCRFVRHRDQLLSACGVDSDELVHDILIRFCAAFLDQGYAHWQMPGREKGFLRAFLELHVHGGRYTHRWLRPLTRLARQWLNDQLTPEQAIEQSLTQLGVEPADREAFIRSSLLALRGWAGMLWQCEIRPDRVFIPVEPGTLIQFMAVRLLLDRLAVEHLARTKLGYRGPLEQLTRVLPAANVTTDCAVSDEQRAYPILQLAQFHGWSPEQLVQLDHAGWKELLTSIEDFGPFERRRVFYLATERRFARMALDALSIRAAQPLRQPQQPQLQVMTCIDAREESFRRHLEEVNPQVETFGNAGFFNVPMYYRGAGDAHFTSLCPIVVKPQHWVVEDVVHSLMDSERQRARVRRIWGTATHGFNTGTRGSIVGAVLTAAIGPLFTIPLVGRILFPRLMANMHRAARGWVAPPPVTRLRLERPEGTTPGPHDEGIGFTLTEMTNMGERALRDTGLTERFARLVIILGHGSNCLNNPHESAYHCGACSGAMGSPNARALAAILNDRRVRRALGNRGIEIPEETHFLGGLHNTADESIKYFDLELIPTSHVRDLREAMLTFEQVARRNAHERCRRFESAPLDLSPLEALHHVENRAEDLSQTRPEYGNATNAMCFVGRRSRVRGLYLDRRSFLMSYDASQDTADCAILTRILGAVVPVCEGINMLYTLSKIDNVGFGSGTKLPHNITSLLGVMDGAASDLRTGIPWQGCDVHEAMRLLFVIEASPESMLQVFRANPAVKEIIANGWAHLAVLDPDSNRIQRYVASEFVDYVPGETSLPAANESLQCYRGKRLNVPFASIEN